MLHMTTSTTDFKSFHLNTDINANANLKTNLTYDGYISGWFPLYWSLFPTYFSGDGQTALSPYPGPYYIALLTRYD